MLYIFMQERNWRWKKTNAKIKLLVANFARYEIIFRSGIVKAILNFTVLRYSILHARYAAHPGRIQRTSLVHDRVIGKRNERSNIRIEN